MGSLCKNCKFSYIRTIVLFIPMRKNGTMPNSKQAQQTVNTRNCQQHQITVLRVKKTGKRSARARSAAKTHQIQFVNSWQVYHQHIRYLMLFFLQFCGSGFIESGFNIFCLIQILTRIFNKQKMKTVKYSTKCCQKNGKFQDIHEGCRNSRRDIQFPKKTASSP